VKVGDLVRSTADATLGVILDLGNRYWDGIRWTVAHTQVTWSDLKTTWELTNSLEVISESR
jgi:hypothetical protein